MQDSGIPEDAEAAQPEDARPGATRRNIAGTAGGEDSGQPGNSTLAQPEDGRVGKTWDLMAGNAGRCGIRGNSMIHQSAPWERIRGDLENRPSAELEDAGLGDARGLIARRH